MVKGLSTVLYIESLGELFIAAQEQRVFKDQKTMVDCLPRYAVAEILEQYKREKHTAGFNIEAFILDHFIPPAMPAASFKTDLSLTPEQHINLLWDLLTRQATDSNGTTLLPLPAKFVVPGGRFREIYYWDSYFTMLGLKVSGRTDLIESMVQNFASLIDSYGHIPNGNRTYYLSRSQPPFFAHMVQLLSGIKGIGVLLEYLPAIEKEYRFWMRGQAQLSPQNMASSHTVKMPDGSILNRYWDEMDGPRAEGHASDIKASRTAETVTPGFFRHMRAACESGWDFSSRWFADGMNIHTICAADIVPVDLNCLLFYIEQTLAKGFGHLGDIERQSFYTDLSNQRKNAIDKYCWNADTGIYHDYHFVNGERTIAATMATAFPLFVKIASSQQAASVLAFIKNNLLQPGGLLTTTVETGQQWDAPNGWAPLQWVGYQSALNYGVEILADTICQNWNRNVERVYYATGKMMEKYDVMEVTEKAGGGEYPNQDGFGWTNGVYLAMKQRD